MSGCGCSFNYQRRISTRRRSARLQHAFVRDDRGAERRCRSAGRHRSRPNDPHDDALLPAWNSTRAMSRAGELVRAVRRAGRRSPDAIASGVRRPALSYGELNAPGQPAGASLRDHGVGPDVWWGWRCERGVGDDGGAAGGAEGRRGVSAARPDYPAERLASCSRQRRGAGADAGRVAAQLFRWQGTGAEAWLLDEQDERRTATPAIRDRRRPRDLAYVIYTSGSTGQPKGVMVRASGADELPGDDGASSRA